MKRGFTLIEMIVAMSVILVLAVLTVSIMQSVREGNREAATRLTIGTVNSLMSERVKSLAGKTYPYQWYHGGVYEFHNTAYPGLWIAPRRTFAAQAETCEPTTITDTAIPADPATWNSDLLRNTVIIFNDLQKYPAGRNVLDKIKSVRVTVDINGAPMTASIPLDAWDRPLLFAPAVGVTIDGATVFQQSTSVTYAVPFGGKGGTYPFCFSAGADGKLGDATAFVR